MNIEEMKQRKKELGYSNAQLAELSGVPLGTVQKIFSGATAAPRYETLRLLEGVLSETPAPPRQQVYRPAGCEEAAMVKESEFRYFEKKQGEYTVEDYYYLPKDKRFELIDGVLYDMSAPSSPHQLIGGFIHAQLFNHIMGKKGQCLPMIAPVDVQLDKDDKTMVQPDVLIVCDRDMVIRRCVYGAPDFIVEVLSPSTRNKDRYVKLHKYSSAGVREYWMIDPDTKKVVVYNFQDEDAVPMVYGFDQQVPVHVLDGECVIDFSAMYEYVRFIYDREESEEAGGEE